MKPLSYRAIIVAAVCAAAVALMVNSVMIRAGFGELNFSWMLGAVCLLVAAGAVWLGVQVARYRRIQTREKVPHMGPILAARAVAYAQGAHHDRCPVDGLVRCDSWLPCGDGVYARFFGGLLGGSC